MDLSIYELANRCIRPLCHASEPPVGFEPTTTRLQGEYSTTELRRRISNGIRTRVATVKGWSPRPLDHGDLERVTRIELALPTWKDGALPLCNTRLYT